MRSFLATEAGVKKTIYNNFVATSDPSSRAAMFTRNRADHSFGQQEAEFLQECEAAAASHNTASLPS